MIGRARSRVWPWRWPRPALWRRRARARMLRLVRSDPGAGAVSAGRREAMRLVFSEAARAGPRRRAGARPATDARSTGCGCEWIRRPARRSWSRCRRCGRGSTARSGARPGRRPSQPRGGRDPQRPGRCRRARPATVRRDVLAPAAVVARWVDFALVAGLVGGLAVACSSSARAGRDAPPRARLRRGVRGGRARARRGGAAAAGRRADGVGPGHQPGAAAGHALGGPVAGAGERDRRARRRRPSGCAARGASRPRSLGARSAPGRPGLRCCGRAPRCGADGGPRTGRPRGGR